MRDLSKYAQVILFELAANFCVFCLQIAILWAAFSLLGVEVTFEQLLGLVILVDYISRKLK